MCWLVMNQLHFKLDAPSFLCIFYYTQTSVRSCWISSSYTKLDLQISARITVLITTHIVLSKNSFKPFGLRRKYKDPRSSCTIWGQEHIKAVITPKRCKIGPRLLLRTNRKSHMRFRLAPTSVTLDALQRRKRPARRNKQKFRAGVPSERGIKRILPTWNEWRQFVDQHVQCCHLNSFGVVLGLKCE